MFMLYAIPLGLLLGWVFGGKIEGLAQARLRFTPLFILAMLVRVVMFETPLGETAWGRAAVPWVNIGVPAALLVVLLPSLQHWGVRLAVLGVACNLLAITANGGWMPLQPDLLIQIKGEAAGQAAIEELARGDEATNVMLAMEQTRLVALTDIFALPAWVPFPNVFSIGDVLTLLGITLWIIEMMRTRDSNASDPGLSLATVGSVPG